MFHSEEHEEWTLPAFLVDFSSLLLPLTSGVAWDIELQAFVSMYQIVYSHKLPSKLQKR